MTDTLFSHVDAEALYMELRGKGFEVAQAVEILGKTAGVLRDTNEYRSLLERSRAYQDAMMVAANLFAMRFGLDTHEILTRSRPGPF